MKILTLEQILKEDVNSFVEWGLKELDTKSYEGEPIKDNPVEAVTFILKKLYNLVEGYSEINAKKAFDIYLNDFIHTPRYIIKFSAYFFRIIQAYIDLINLEPKRYSIKLRKINKNSNFETIKNVREYIIDTLNKMNNIKTKKVIKKKNKDKRMADEFLYEDDNVKISLFTKFQTAKETFGGISNWCVTKSLNYWRTYSSSGILVLFNNKKVDYKSREETPNAFVCNHCSIRKGRDYRIGKDKYDDFINVVTYDLKDKVIYDDDENFTRDYDDIVKEKCAKLFGGNLSDWKNVVEVEGRDKYFFAVEDDNLINGNVVAKNMITFGNDDFFDIRSDNYDQENYNNLIGAEFYGGLRIKNAILDKTSFPDIDYVSDLLVLESFRGDLNIYKNDLSNIIIDRDGGFEETYTNVSFQSSLDLVELSFFGSDFDVSVKCKKGMSVKYFRVIENIFSFESNTDTEVSYDNGSDTWTIEALKSNGELNITDIKSYVNYLSYFNYLDINGFDKVNFYINSYKEIEEGRYTINNVEELHFYIKNYDKNIDDIKDMTEDIDTFKLNDTEVFYHED